MMRISTRKKILVAVCGLIAVSLACALPGDPQSPDLAMDPLVLAQQSQTAQAEIDQTANPTTPTLVTPKPSATLPQPVTLRPTNTVTVTWTPSVTPVPPTKTPFTPDPQTNLGFFDFSDSAGWASGSVDGRYSFGVADNGYNFNILVPYIEIWSVREQRLGRVRLEVKIERSSGPPDGYFGLVCYWQDADNYMRLAIRNNGEYTIAHQEDGELIILAQGTYAPMPVPGQHQFNLVASCIDNNFELRLNGQVLATVLDSTISSGYVGMVAGTLSEGGLDVLFDDLGIYQP